MTARFSKGRCSKCRQEVYLGVLPSEQRGKTGRPMMTLNATPVPSAIAVPPGPDTLEAWTVAGELLHVRSDFDGSAPDLGVTAYLDHRLGCPVERRRAASPPEPAQRIHLPDGVAGDVVSCRECGISIQWMDTANGRRVPVETTGHVGFLLSAEEASALKGDPRLVRGYRSNGDLVPIQRCAPEEPACEGRELTTVYVAHFATCLPSNPTEAPASA